MLTKVDYRLTIIAGLLSVSLTGCLNSTNRVAVQKSKQPSYEKIIEKYIYADESIKTVSILNRILAKYPNNKDAYFYRGWANIVKRDYNAAINDFDIALQIDPDFAKAYAYKGYMLAYKLEKYEESVSYFDRAMLSGINNISVYKENEIINLNYAKSESFKKMHNFNEALHCVNLAMKSPHQNNDTIIKNNLQRSSILFEMNRYEEAYADLTRALNYPHDKYSPALYTQLGRIDLCRGNIDQAISYFNKSNNTNNNTKSKEYAENLYLIGLSKLLNGEKFDGKNLIEKAFKIDMFHSQAPFVLGYIAHISGNRSKAKVLYKIAKGLDPSIIQNRQNHLQKINAQKIKNYYNKEIKTALLYIK